MEAEKAVRTLTKKEKRLNPLVEEIKKLFIGFHRDEINYIFEKAIIGLYQMQSRTLNGEGKYKIVLRETDEEVSLG